MIGAKLQEIQCRNNVATTRLVFGFYALMINYQCFACSVHVFFLLKPDLLVVI
jgi:hypothetical protein